MKKIILLTALSLTMVMSGFAQKRERTDAYLALQKGKLKEAKAAIDQAVKNPKTINDAKTWLYYGEIYYKISTSMLPAYRKLDSLAAPKALAGLNKAVKLDDKHKRITEDAKKYIGKLAKVFYAEGADHFKAKDYASAVKSFRSAFDISKSLGKVDTTIAYNIGICAFMANEPKVAADFLKQCIDLKFKEPKLYIFYARSLKAQGDTAAAKKALELGKTRFPKSLSILLEQAQIYLEQGKTKELVSNLKEAIARRPGNPSNANFYFLIGKSFDDAGNSAKAEENYKKAIGINPKFYEAYYNIGAIFINKAAIIQKQANNLPLSKEKEYKALNDSANAQLRLALPWLEKSLKLRPGNTLSVTALKEAYTRLKMYKQLKELNSTGTVTDDTTSEGGN